MAGDRSFSDYVHPKYVRNMPGTSPGDVEKPDARKSGKLVITDPADHNVDVVVKYMRDNPGEVDRIKTLESQGEKRKTILEHEVGR